MENLNLTFGNIEKLAAACRAEIDASDRPLDVIAIEAILPVFFVHPDHQEAWQRGVAPEVWGRIHRLKQKPTFLVVSEAELRVAPFALTHGEMRQLRNGPLLKMMSLVDLRLSRRKGGRIKREVELAVREALEFEVFRRDVEIGALISCMRARYDGVEIEVTKGSGIASLADLAWLPGVPTKGKAANPNAPEIDRRLALFETLRSEGEKRAVMWVPGLTAPSEVEAAIVSQVRERAHGLWTRADFGNAILVATSWVQTMMKTCAHVTVVAEQKHQLAKRAKKVELLRRPSKGDSFFHREPMTRQQHMLFVGNEFSAIELAFVAVVADVDPNLITTNHILATPEFHLARKLGRTSRDSQTSFDLEEVKDLKELILGERGHADGAMYREVHRYLAECALEILPMDEWLNRVNEAIARGQELVLPSSR